MKRLNLIGLLAACLSACAAGCVDREMVITSEPAGALVYVSDVEVGRTPVRVPFTWYGDYDIVLRHEGQGQTQFQTLKTHRHLTPPVYEVPPLDLLSAMAPWTYRDTRYLHFQLEPLGEPSQEELLQNARELREKTLQPVR